MGKNRFIYVAFDSDVLCMLVMANNYREGIGEYNKDTCKDELFVKYSGYLFHVVDLIRNGEIRPFILNTVFNETCFSENVQDVKNFVIKYGWFPDINENNRLTKREKVKKLAEEYCKDFEINGSKIYAPMSKVYNYVLDDHIPSNDAYIMAESTVENVLFVTANEKDYIYQGKNDTKNRAFGICTINTNNGYYYLNKNNEKIAPKPMAFKLFGALMKDYGVERFFAHRPHETIRAFEILDKGQEREK